MPSSKYKSVVVLIFLVLVCIQCQTTKRIYVLRREYKSIYINQFKLTYLRQMLIKGYNNSDAIRQIIEFDHSGFTEIILTPDDYHLIDSLTNLDNQKMIIDSSVGNTRAEGAQGKRPLSFVFDKLNSKWLDSLAHKRYKNSGLKKEPSEY